MDLRNGTIRVKEILSVPGAKAILVRELPQMMNSPMVRMAGNMSLNQVLSYAKGHVSQEKINSILRQLKEV